MLPSEPVTPLSPVRLLGGFGSGAAIGIVGGLIGLGGAEIRLPVLIAFGFDALPAVILNRALSLVVVASALPFRAEAVPYADVAAHGPIILTMLAGSLAGAFTGATYATRFASRTLFRAIAVLLLVTAVLLVAGGDPELRHMPVDGTVRVVAGVAAGFAIGLAVAMMGVAGGELLVPTLVLLFSLPVKLAGSVALVIALPTILVGFARDNTIGVIRDNAPFLGVMVAGSITGTFIGGQLLGILPSVVLLPLLGLILVASAVKIWRHSTRQDHA